MVADRGRRPTAGAEEAASTSALLARWCRCRTEGCLAVVTTTLSPRVDAHGQHAPSQIGDRSVDCRSLRPGRSWGATGQWLPSEDHRAWEVAERLDDVLDRSLASNAVTTSEALVKLATNPPPRSPLLGPTAPAASVAAKKPTADDVVDHVRNLPRGARRRQVQLVGLHAPSTSRVVEIASRSESVLIPALSPRVRR